MEIKVDTRGLEKLARDLQLTAIEGRDLEENCVRDIGDMFFRIVRKNTPVDTGYMKAHWELTGAGISLRIRNDTRYLPFVEEGTYKMAPRYFVKRSIAEGNSRAPLIVENTIRTMFSRF